ncbi:MAG: ATP-binding cassette domain-containing protein [Clostridiales bacterium]|nr:ATP-binding cassette domain-containing protein [Clostridiales bacterium]
MLEIKNVSKTFAPGTVNAKKALQQLSLTVKDDDFITIIGSNGAGKSTLFNVICGNFLPDEGHIMLDGKDITYEKEHKRAKEIGRVFQDPMRGTAPDMTLEENLALAYKTSGEHGFCKALSRRKREFFREQAARFAMGLEDRMKTKVGLLSGGQRQVVTLLMSTMITPKLLLLDEHTAALDPATAEKIMEITKTVVAENKIPTLMITHNIEQALTTGTKTVMMDDGQILLEIDNERRAGMSVESLLALYKEKKNQAFTNDRMLMS